MSDNALKRLYKKLSGMKCVYSPVRGELVLAKDINDPTFAEEMIGKTVAVRPSNGNVYAPFDGEILLIFDTKHAMAIKSDDGIELMIHFGLDTVKMEGKPFDVKVKVGDKVKKGDLLMCADIEMIKKDGFDPIVPMVITNFGDFKTINVGKKSEVDENDIIFEIIG